MARRPRRDRDSGFALIEYIVSVGIMGVIVGVLTAAVVIVIRNQESSQQRNDAANGSTGLTNYFPADIAATPPGGREVALDLASGCSGYTDSGYNVVRLTWSETLSDATTQFRAAYRLVPSGETAKLVRVSCDGSGGTFGSATARTVAFALAAVPQGWTPGSAPAALDPLAGDDAISLTLTSESGSTYTVQGSRLNPASSFPPSVPPDPFLQLETTMSLSTPNYSTAGEILTYTVTVSNSGARSLTNVATYYSNADSTSTCTYLLAPGVSTTCQAQHVVTQDDLDGGFINAGVAAVGYFGLATAGAVATNEIPAAAAPSVSPVMATSSAGYRAEGETIPYTLTVTNNGNITLVGLTAAFSNASATGTCSPLPLAPGAIATCTGTHTVTSGEYLSDIVNTATVFGTTANFGDTTAVTTPDVTVPFVPQPSMAVSAFTINPTPFVRKDDALTFAVTLTNNGNVDLSGVAVSYSIATSSPSCPSTLGRGASITCTATYLVSQPDVDFGSLTVTASASGTYGALLASASANATAPANGKPSVSLLLTSTASQYTSVGQVIPYTLSVKNVGDVSITAITPTYANATATASCAPLPLAPGSTATCTASHTVTTAEFGNTVTAGASAIATGSTGGNTPTVSAANLDVTFLPVPQIAVTALSASPTPFTAIGQTVTMTATILNTGNVALSNVAATWTNATTYAACPTTLAIGASATCTARFTVAALDSMAGVTASVSVAGTYSTTTVTAQASSTVPSAVPCTVVSATSGGIADPTSVAIVTTNGPNKGYLSQDIRITIYTSALCTGLRIKYSPQSPNSVIAEMTMDSSGVWIYTIPGQDGAAPATWKTGAKQVQVLPAATVGNTAIYTNSAAFTVT